MTDKPRNWQEDMNGCAVLPPTPWAWVETDEGEWIEDANKQLILGSENEYFDDLLGGDVSKEAFIRFVINAPQALPYWLQRALKEKGRADTAESDYQSLSANYDALEKERDFWENKRTEHKQRADQAESLIQQKDREIYHLKKSIEALL